MWKIFVRPHLKAAAPSRSARWAGVVSEGGLLLPGFQALPACSAPGFGFRIFKDNSSFKGGGEGWQVSISLVIIRQR